MNFQIACMVVACLACAVIGFECGRRISAEYHAIKLFGAQCRIIDLKEQLEEAWGQIREWNARWLAQKWLPGPPPAQSPPAVPPDDPDWWKRGDRPPDWRQE